MEVADRTRHAMLQMRQSMPNNIPSLRKYEVHPVDLPKMWVDCYPSEDTNDSEGGEIMTEIRYYNILTYCSIPNCINDANYACVSDGLLQFICKECRLRGETI